MELETVNKLYLELSQFATATTKKEIDLQAESLKRDALIMANARRLIKAPKRTSNRELYSELFGTGSGTATKRCNEIGLDPDGNECNFTQMHNHIAEGGAI